MSADPSVPDPLDSQSWNPYSYVRNNPVNAVDPTGFVDEGNYALEFEDVALQAAAQAAVFTEAAAVAGMEAQVAQAIQADEVVLAQEVAAVAAAEVPEGIGSVAESPIDALPAMPINGGAARPAVEWMPPAPGNPTLAEPATMQICWKSPVADDRYVADRGWERAELLRARCTQRQAAGCSGWARTRACRPVRAGSALVVPPGAKNL